MVEPITPTYEGATETMREEYGIDSVSDSLTKKVQDAVQRAVEEYPDVLSFSAEQVKGIGVTQWDAMYSQATVVPLGVEYVPHEWTVSDSPEKCLLYVEGRARDRKDGVYGSVKHELAHFEDWRRRLTTNEHDEEFKSLLDVLGANENGQA